MATPPTQQTSRGQLAAVVLALALATLTFLIPLAAVSLLLTAVLAFAAGATALRLAHGLDPGAFSAGFYLATLLLLGAGGWQLVYTARAWQAARSLRRTSPEASPSEALVPDKPKPGGVRAAVKQQPFMLLGVALLVVDAFLVRWEIRGKLDSPDGLLAAAILASMLWAQILVAVLSVRLTVLLWRTLVRSSRRSPYAAGLVTAFGLAISLASVLGLRSVHHDAAEAASHQSVVTSIEGAPSASSPIEQMRLALVEFAEPKKTEDRQPLVKETVPVAAAAAAAPEEPTDPAALADAAAAAASALAPPAAPAPTPEVTPAAASEGESLPAAAAAEDSEAPLLDLSFGPPFAKCVDRLTQRSPDDDPIQREVARIVRRFGISEHDARALVIETLVSVCLKKGEDREDLRRYLKRSITNAARNFLTRYLHRHRTCSIELVPVIDFPDETSIWRYTDDTETRAQKAFCALDELDQAIIQARVMRDLTFRQIGDIIGLGEDGARKAFDRALRRLKEKFEKS
jgi:RNA polymerase sigma factor (sigma-70 family)